MSLRERLRRPLRLLLLEDHRGDDIPTRDHLKRIDPGGFDVVCAPDIEVAEDLLRGSDFDLHLVDYRLGSRCGLDFLRRRVAEGSRVPVILLAGQGERAVDEEALEAGADDVLVKGCFDAAALARSIRYALERRHTRDALESAKAELERRVDERMRELAALNASLGEANERLRVEVAEKQRLYDLALQAGRMRDEFLASVTHELRSPLNVIGGYVSLLELEVGEGGSTSFRMAIEAIKRSVKSQTVLIGDLLDASGIVTGKMRLAPADVELEKVIGAALDTVRFAAQVKDVRVVLDLPRTPTFLKADPDRLQQIFWNLLSNAIKFSYPGGRVGIAVERSGDAVRVAVRDGGVGIAPEFLPHVFDRFRQEDATARGHSGGLGLGLAIARHVAELHGGGVSASSGGRGRGATFVVTLPCRSALPSEAGTFVVAASGAGAAPSGTSTPGTPGTPGTPENVVAHGMLGAEGPPREPHAVQLAGLTITLLEDEEDTRQLYAWFLEARGARVLESSVAAESLEAVRRERPDVILSDIGMPGEDGVAFLRKVRALPVHQGGATPAIALTAYGDERMIREIRAAGFNRYIHKPVSLEELAGAILTFAGRGGSEPRSGPRAD